MADLCKLLLVVICRLEGLVDVWRVLNASLSQSFRADRRQCRRKSERKLGLEKSAGGTKESEIEDRLEEYDVALVSTL
jgi:hypothetical protein